MHDEYGARFRPGRSGSVASRGYDLKLHRFDVFDQHFKIVRHFAGPALKLSSPDIGPRGTMVFTGKSGNAVVDLRSGRETRFKLPSTDEVPQYAPADAKVLTFTDINGRLSVLNLATGSVADGRTVAHESDAKFIGNGIAFPDAIAFDDVVAPDSHTLVVPYDGSAPYVVSGRALWVSGDTALTAQDTGPQTDRIELWQRNSSKGSMVVESDVISALPTGPSSFTLFTEEDRVLSADLAHHTTTTLATLGGAGQFAVELSADRVLVGDPQSAGPSQLVDEHGHVVATFPPVGGKTVWLGVAFRRIGSPCFVTQAGTQYVVNGGGVALRDTETGAVRARFSGSAALLRTPDGCSAVYNEGAHAEVALDGRFHRFAQFGTVQAVSPDRQFVLASGTAGASGSATGFAAVDVRTGHVTQVPVGIYAWVSGAA